MAVAGWPRVGSRYELPLLLLVGALFSAPAVPLLYSAVISGRIEVRVRAPGWAVSRMELYFSGASPDGAFVLPLSRESATTFVGKKRLVERALRIELVGPDGASVTLKCGGVSDGRRGFDVTPALECRHGSMLAEFFIW